MFYFITMEPLMLNLITTEAVLVHSHTMEPLLNFATMEGVMMNYITMGRSCLI